MKYFCYDFSAPILNYENRPMALPGGAPGSAEVAAMFSHFALQALRSVYEGENLSYEAKAFRSALADKIALNIIAVNLSFIERVTICSLVSNITQSPIIFQRFVEFLEKTDIPSGGYFASPNPVDKTAEVPAPVVTDTPAVNVDTIEENKQHTASN